MDLKPHTSEGSLENTVTIITSPLNLLSLDIFYMVLDTLYNESLPSLLNLSLVSKGFYSETKKFIYRSVTIHNTPRAAKRLPILFDQIRGDDELCAYILEVYMGRSIDNFYHQNKEEQISNLLWLLDRLPRVQRLFWDVGEAIPRDVIGFINVQRPNCQLWLGDNACSFSDPREILHLQDSSCLVALTISLYACEIKAFELLQQTLLTCRKLRTLDLDIWFQNISFEVDEPKILGFKLKPNEKFPPLKSLTLSGFHFGRSLEAKGLWREAIDFAQLTSLTLHDDAFTWWQEPGLNSLKSFEAKWPRQLKMPSDRSPFELDLCSFFSRNKNLENLDLTARFTWDFNFAWLEPIGSTLRTLCLHEFSRTIEVKNDRQLLHSDVCFLGQTLPHVRVLKLDMGRHKTWPYEMLTTIALSFPNLYYLIIHIGFSGRQALSSSPEIENCQLPKMSRIASSWSHLWNILSGEYCCLSREEYDKSISMFSFCKQKKGQTTQIHALPQSQRQPLLKSLFVVIGPPSSSGSQAFRVALSERAEDARCGKASVASQDVEDIIQQMRELPTRSIQSEQFGDMCQNLLQARRKAEEGFFDPNDQRSIVSESWQWGAKRTVTPKEDAH